MILDSKINYIVTAANHLYYKSFCQLMYSYHRAKEYQNSNVIFFNLGLDQDQADKIIHQKESIFKNVEYRVFPFDEYPEFVQPQYMTWAWKPIIIDKVLNEKKGNIFWMDSANQILKNLKPLWKVIQETGSYIPLCGTGLLTEFTMQQTLDGIGVPKSQYQSRNRAGNTCAFSFHNKDALKLVKEWKNLCLIKEYVLPDGSNRSNHRGDQSILSSLIVSRDYIRKMTLTTDEVNISSGSPTKYISVRNRFPKFIPLPHGYLAFHYFKIVRLVDIIINKVRGN